MPFFCSVYFDRNITTGRSTEKNNTCFLDSYSKVLFTSSVSVNSRVDAWNKKYWFQLHHSHQASASVSTLESNRFWTHSNVSTLHVASTLTLGVIWLKRLGWFYGNSIVMILDYGLMWSKHQHSTNTEVSMYPWTEENKKSQYRTLHSWD